MDSGQHEKLVQGALATLEAGQEGESREEHALLGKSTRPSYQTNGSSSSNHGIERRLSTKEARAKRQALRRQIWQCTVASLACNMVLFSFKIYISIASRSLAVMASAIDSMLDLVSQTIIYYALRGTRKVDEEKYPVGRSRLEPIGIIVCASLMGITAIQLVWESTRVLIRGTIEGEDPATLIPIVGHSTLVMLSSAIAIKMVLFAVCNKLRDESDSMMVLAEDHRNDILSNSMALISSYLANRYVNIWWLDPIGGIVIALYICIMWISVAQEQAGMLEGVAAEPEFLEEVRAWSNNFHEKMYADVVRGYHFGKRYLVEVEVVLPGSMTVLDAHDISLELQKKIESHDRVERAFVHVDYQTRDENEHKQSYYITPQSTPTGFHRDQDIDESFEAQLDDIEEDVQVEGTLFAKALPPPTVHKITDLP